MTEYNYRYLCKKCRVTHDIEDLDRIEKHGHPAGVRCPECHGEQFVKVPLEK
jgi:DNA-directed RNA polymerase subunit RPC12/RpoP